MRAFKLSELSTVDAEQVVHASSTGPNSIRQVSVIGDLSPKEKTPRQFCRYETSNFRFRLSAFRESLSPDRIKNDFYQGQSSVCETSEKIDIVITRDIRARPVTEFSRALAATGRVDRSQDGMCRRVP